jgi:hypothetical protein
MLRFQGEKNLRRRMGFPEGCGREALSRMTNDQAQQIIKYLAAYEFPEFHLLALQFGLFKVRDDINLRIGWNKVEMR